MHSAIYQGVLRHRRFFPKRHAFSYSATLFYLDLDELPDLFCGVAGWSYNARNLGCFRREDYLGDPAITLKEAVCAEVQSIHGYCPAGAVRMLTNLRIFGFCFNPVTLYYLFEPQATTPALILAQVNNTPWNERHSYVITCEGNTGKTDTHFAKQFHVSPFNPLAMQYRWVSTHPAERLLVHMENHQHDDVQQKLTCHMDATLRLIYRPWSADLLQKILWQQPWLAIKVPCAIYWQAAKLFFKGVPFYSHTKIAKPNGSNTLKTSAEKS